MLDGPGSHARPYRLRRARLGLLALANAWGRVRARVEARPRKGLHGARHERTRACGGIPRRDSGKPCNRGRGKVGPRGPPGSMARITDRLTILTDHKAEGPLRTDRTVTNKDILGICPICHALAATCQSDKYGQIRTYSPVFGHIRTNRLI